MLMHYKTHMENLFSKKIKTIRTDGGGEFTSSSFKSFLTQHGVIQHQPDLPPRIATPNFSSVVAKWLRNSLG